MYKKKPKKEEGDKVQYMHTHTTQEGCIRRAVQLRHPSEGDVSSMPARTNVHLSVGKSINKYYHHS